MSYKGFDFPLGIRPWQSEWRRFRQLRDGYVFSLMDHSADSYRFTAMAGSARIEALFRAFADVLPEECFFILEYYPEEEEERSAEEDVRPMLFYSPYLPTEEILACLESYFPRLVHDGFVGFGLANNASGMELFFSEEKILTCFTGNHIRVMDLMHRFGLPYAKNQLFTTDLGHDHLSLLCHPAGVLPAELTGFSETELDYLRFCQELTELLEMYPVEDDMSFFLSAKEQAFIARRLEENEDLGALAEEDFGDLLLSWNDFVQECESGFEGGLEDYHDGLRLRDLIQFVIEGVPDLLARKLIEVVRDADRRLQRNLEDSRKRLDSPDNVPLREDRFWYHGVVRNQGVSLRRDLIRRGWFRP